MSQTKIKYQVVTVYSNGTTSPSLTAFSRAWDVVDYIKKSEWSTHTVFQTEGQYYISNKEIDFETIFNHAMIELNAKRDALCPPKEVVEMTTDNIKAITENEARI